MTMRPTGRRTRPAALLLLVAGMLTAVVLPFLAAPSVAGTSARAGGGPVTVPAPGAGDNASVTISRTTQLVNQTVRVSWAGFQPSSATRLQNSGDSLDVNTQDPVRVYECRGADPASSSDCYGSPGFRGLDATDTTPAYPAVPPFTYPGQTDPYDATPDGPANWQDNVTGPNGKGQVAIQVFTKRESAGLGCDSNAACSIVVVPNYGRAPNDNGDTEDLMDAPWAWDRRTVVPLHFLPVEDSCPLTGSTLSVEGSPIAADLLASWRPTTCTLKNNAVNLDYTAIGEPQTRQDVASGTTGLGLVIDPLGKAAAKTAGIVYAPVSVSGLVVAFQIDDANGRPVTHLRLDARLVAKLITASYRTGGDPAVADNPVNLFHDPEFLKLNPGVQWPSGAPGNHPLLLGDQDLSTTFAPISGMSALAQQLSIAQFPGALVTQENGVNITTKPPRQNPGAREVIGFIDAADASRYLLSTASLQNAGGAYVKPTTASFDAAIAHSKVNADGVTRRVDLSAKNKRIYPLTSLISAALSTHAPSSERTQMAHFLDYVAGPGQVPGNDVGQLPAGHAPLTGALKSEVTKARTAVLAGPTGDPSDGPTDGPSDGPTSSPTDGTPSGGDPIGPAATPSTVPLDSAPSGGPSPSSGPSTSDQADAAPDMATVAAQTPGARLLTLPGLLVLALIGLLAGPLILWLERTGRGPKWLRR
jgi:ABC-type phosphate transport system substrate-binding protein